MKKTILIRYALILFLPVYSFAQTTQLPGRSFVMECYYKKHSDTLCYPKLTQHLVAYQKYTSETIAYQNNKTAQKVYTAQLANEPRTYKATRYSPDYYDHYRRTIARKETPWWLRML